MKDIFNKGFWSRNLFLMVMADAFMVAAALFLAFMLRYDGYMAGRTFRLFITILPVYVVVKLVVFYFFGLYRGMWRYTGLRDLTSIYHKRIAYPGQEGAKGETVAEPA